MAVDEVRDHVHRRGRDDRRTPELRRFEEKTAVPMLMLAVIALALLVYEVVTEVSAATQRALDVVDISISVVFAWEYAWSLRLAGRGGRAEFVRTHVLDALAIVPIFQPFRILRSLRVIRTARVARGVALFGRGVQDLRYRLDVSDIPWLMVITGLFVVLLSALAYGVERDAGDATITSFGDALWWGLSTATTVGSSFEPVTTEGRVIALMLMLVGISLIATMAGLFAERFVVDDEEAARHLSTIDRRIGRLEMTWVGSVPDPTTTTGQDALLGLCYRIAERAHDGQVDKAGVPYIGHPVRVASRVEHPGAKMVALLHDVLEDTPVGKANLLEEGVPEDIVRAVEILTKTETDYGAFIQRIVDSGDDVAIAVKRADIADNLDASRLAQLSEAEADRLKEKYTRVLGILEEA